MNNRILLRTLLIFSSLAVVLEGCYLFCLFRPESTFEEMIEQFIEDEIGEDEDFSPVCAEEFAQIKKNFDSFE